MTQHDFLTLLEEGVQNGRIAPHLAAYIAAEIQASAGDVVPDDEEARAALTPADQRTPAELARRSG